MESATTMNTWSNHNEYLKIQSTWKMLKDWLSVLNDGGKSATTMNTWSNHNEYLKIQSTWKMLKDWLSVLNDGGIGNNHEYME